MVENTQTKIPKLIHVAYLFLPKKGKRFLFLRKMDDHHYQWFQDDGLGNEVETGVGAPVVEEAMRLAQQEWKYNAFRTLICGFRYTLPERDEHGMNALFHHMVASYSTPTGVYFDEDLGHNCFVQFASIEARTLWQKLKEQKRI